jgi:hypothetical protein
MVTVRVVIAGVIWRTPPGLPESIWNPPLLPPLPPPEEPPDPDPPDDEPGKPEPLFVPQAARPQDAMRSITKDARTTAKTGRRAWRRAGCGLSTLGSACMTRGLIRKDRIERSTLIR